MHAYVGVCMYVFTVCVCVYMTYMYSVFVCTRMHVCVHVHFNLLVSWCFVFPKGVTVYR